MKKIRNNNKRMKDNEFEDMTLAIANGLLVDKKTAAIVKPYIRTMQVEEAAAFLKCLAGLLIVDDDDREKICKEMLDDEADFVLMMVRELDRIIKE